ARRCLTASTPSAPTGVGMADMPGAIHVEPAFHSRRVAQTVGRRIVADKTPSGVLRASAAGIASFGCGCVAERKVGLIIMRLSGAREIKVRRGRQTPLQAAHIWSFSIALADHFSFNYIGILIV